MDLVMRINSVQKSSKSELSSRGKSPFKVFSFSRFFASKNKMTKARKPFKSAFGTPYGKQKSHKPKTLNGRLPLEDSSDFDGFWTELIVMTTSFI